MRLPVVHAPLAPGSFLLLWDSIPLLWSERETGGLYSLLLDSEGRAVGSHLKLLTQAYEDDTGGSTGKLWFFHFHQYAMIAPDSGSYVLALCTKTLPPVADVHYDLYLLKLDYAGGIIQNTLVDTGYAYAGRMAMISSKLFLATWYQGGDAKNYFNRAFSTDAKPVKSSYSPLPDGSVNYSDVMKLEGGKSSYQVSISATEDSPPEFEDNMFYGRFIKKSGKASREPTQLFYAGGEVTDLRAAGVPPSKGVLLVYCLKESDDLQHIWAYLLKAR